MTPLEEKHFDAIREHRFSDFEDLLEMAAKDCAKISHEFAIELSKKDNNTMFKMLSKIVSDVDKLSEEDDDYIIDSDFVQEIAWFLKKFTTPDKPQA
jgi:hypothetical protein